MVNMIVDFAQYLGMAIRPGPGLANGEWCFEKSDVVVAHDIWERLDLPIYEMEFLLPDEGMPSYEHSTD